METIESTIREYYNKDKNSSSSNDSADSSKRRRDAAKDFKDGDDIMENTDRSSKRATKTLKKRVELDNSKDPYYYDQCVDDALDFEDFSYDAEMNGSDSKPDQNGAGRVLPSWSKVEKKGDVFKGYAFKG